MSAFTSWAVLALALMATLSWRVAALPYLKICGSIISLVPIDMMHHFVIEQCPPEMASHDETVLKHRGSLTRSEEMVFGGIQYRSDVAFLTRAAAFTGERIIVSSSSSPVEWFMSSIPQRERDLIWIGIKPDGNLSTGLTSSVPRKQPCDWGRWREFPSSGTPNPNSCGYEYAPYGLVVIAERPSDHSNGYTRQVCFYESAGVPR